MTAKIKIKKLISRTKFESAQKDATELHSVVERLGLGFGHFKERIDNRWSRNANPKQREYANSFYFCIPILYRFARRVLHDSP